MWNRWPVQVWYMKQGTQSRCTGTPQRDGMGREEGSGWGTCVQPRLIHVCCCWVASVMSNSVRPHRRQPTRLPRPWDSPGKNTGVGCYFLLQCMKVKSQSEVAQSCPTLSDPMDCSLPGSSIHGIFQARVLEWGAIAFSTGSCQCMAKTTIIS